jgi:hypothetical protein
MKKYFTFYLIFSVFFFGQQGLFAGSNSSVEKRLSKSTDDHQHSHAFTITLNMIFFGIVEHDHEHNHDEDFSTCSTQNHKSKSHSHFGEQKLKIDLVAPKSIVSFQETIPIVFMPNYSRLNHFDFSSEIFRPPIFC